MSLQHDFAHFLTSFWLPREILSPNLAQGFLKWGVYINIYVPAAILNQHGRSKCDFSMTVPIFSIGSLERSLSNLAQEFLR